MNAAHYATVECAERGQPEERPLDDVDFEEPTKSYRPGTLMDDGEPWRGDYE